MAPPIPVFLGFSSHTLYQLIAAMFVGPGHVPLGWSPPSPKSKSKKSTEVTTTEVTRQYDGDLQYCAVCEGYKAPRSHHCRKCGRCVKKMDHHCPWINNCVGHENHGHFVGFLASAVAGCSQAAVILAMSIYYGLNRNHYHYYGTGNEPKVVLTLFSLIAYLFALGMAIGVVLAVGALLYFQLRSVWRNATGIEEWILEKAAYRLRHAPEAEKFKNPYDLGKVPNLLQVLSPSCFAAGDGLEHWPLREGAGKYDLTREQIRQKADKRIRTRVYQVVTPYSGSWCPLWSMGFRVACSPPCADEPRIPLDAGDEVAVTRWKRHWLYGDKAMGNAEDSKGAKRVRGWFPRKCAVEVVDHSCEGTPRKVKVEGKGEAKKNK